jgi:hypothetical protein
VSKLWSILQVDFDCHSINLKIYSELLVAERLKDIKQTASDAVEIIRELGSPDVQDSLDKIRDTAQTAREIIESLKTPEMVRNIENIRLMSEAVESTAAKIENITLELKRSGVVDAAGSAVKSVSGGASSGTSTQNSIAETAAAIRDMLRSIAELANELRATVSVSRKSESGIIRNTEEAFREASGAYRSLPDSG